ncbi:tetratricopeptide repeat protein [Mucilaginibacter limnophilus]|uniref:Tetratricopeptide repeat protein n=1 Tax=Mucilaginibacter limnophilus TaxID=1932778 RepID=A0A3S2Y1N7_9SPHI|nr:tetratricopeptide repeat protein [Mucilaginibacter limnophilus]RVU01367.1 tetratricopeptide repeat protein [Mucilaginibacter limnophilus]
MRSLYRIGLYAIGMLLLPSCIFAQGKRASEKLLTEANRLREKGSFDSAVVKYNEALEADPKNKKAELGLALSLDAAGNRSQAAVIMEKLLKQKGNTKQKAELFDLLGCIYDDMGQPAKAIELYRAGISADPKFVRIYYNLGITCLREKRFTDAEQAAESAIKLDTEHAPSQWLYAMVNYYQGRRVNAIIAICSYLLMEPESEKGIKAYKAMENLLNAGFTERGTKLITSDSVIINPQTEPAGNVIAKKIYSVSMRKLKPVDALQAYLTVLFETAAEQTVYSNDNKFFRRFYIDYFYQLRLSENMPAFARYISMGAYKDENLKWFAKYPNLLQELDAWLNDTRRKF